MKTCDRCGQPTTEKKVCPGCSSKKKAVFHNLCADCVATYEVFYFCEGNECFLKEPVLKTR